MGQAKARGTFEERKAEAIAAGRIPRRLRGDNKTSAHYRIDAGQQLRALLMAPLVGAMVDRR